MSAQIIICLVIFALSLVAFGLNKWNMGVVASVMMFALVVTKCIEPKVVLDNVGNQNVVVMAAMMIVAAGFSKTQLVTKLSDLIYKLGKGSFDHCLRLFIFMAWVLIPFAGSPMARIAILYPILTATCLRCDVSPSKGMYALGLIGLIGAIGLPIGNGAIAYINLNTYLEKYGADAMYRLSVLDPFKARLVPGLIILLYCMFIAPKLSPDTPPVPIEGLKVKEKAKQEPLPRTAEIAGYVIFIANTLAILLADKIGVPAYVSCVLAAALMHAFGVLSIREVRQAFPMNMLVLLIGCLCMGDALISTGAGQLIGDKLGSLLNGVTNHLLINGLFFLLTFTMTQFMNNAGAMNIVRPIIILVCTSLGYNPVGPVLIISMAGMAAFLTPMATTSIPIMMAAGGYDQKSLLKQGWLPALIYGVVTVAWVSFLFPLT